MSRPTEAQRPVPHPVPELARASVRNETNAIPAKVRVIVARTHGDGLASRMPAVRALGKNLGAAERRALYDFLLDPHRVDDLTADQEYVLVNEIMKELRQQTNGAPMFGAVLAAIYRNVKQAPVLRDYAIQHLGEWCMSVGHDAAAEKVLYEALANVGSYTAGTALIAIDKTYNSESSTGTQQIVASSLALASKTFANKGARACGIAICAQKDIRVVIPVARKASKEASVPLRLSASAVLRATRALSDDNMLKADCERVSPQIESMIYTQ